VSAPAGQHDISVKKLGFKSWDRKIRVSSGQVNVHAALEGNGIESGAGRPPVSPNTEPRIEAPAQVTQRSVSNDGFIGASSNGDPKLRQDGISLSHIAEGGPASQAGLKVGDVILAIDDHYVFTIDELASEIRQHAPGTSVRIRYRRRSLIYEGAAKVSEKAANERF
jgi:S1-C subfamily serine protease